MISASEPLEFVPHGRKVLENHPEMIYRTGGPESSLADKLHHVLLDDDSIDMNEELPESWCVREVPCRDTKDKENSSKCKKVPTTNAHAYMKNDNSMRNDMSFRKIDGSKLHISHLMNNRNRSSMTNGTSVTASKVLVHKIKTESCYEEELYIKGRTAVWSKGIIASPNGQVSGPDCRETISCFTIDHMIKFALFCTFHESTDTNTIYSLPTVINETRQTQTDTCLDKSMPSILLIDSKNMTVYSEDGREYKSSIPFPVKRVWSMKHGVLFEKEQISIYNQSQFYMSSINASHMKSKSTFNASNFSSRDSSMTANVKLPTCFSISHPLDEITPVIMKSNDHYEYFNDGELQILHVSSNPSVALIYDWKQRRHSLWFIRKATKDECMQLCPNASLITNTFNQTDLGSMMTSHAKNTTCASTSVSILTTTKKGKNPKVPKKSVANVILEEGLTSITPRPSMSMSMMASPAQPLYPEICLDLLWSDPQTVVRDSANEPCDMKAFLHTDFVGSDYLCFMVKLLGWSKLHVLKLQKVINLIMKLNVVMGSSKTFRAKDVVHLEKMHMYALLDETGNVVLYTGTHLVGKVHVGGMLISLIDSPYARSANYQSPFPRRSSLLPSRPNDVSVFDDSALHLLSPVPHASSSKLEQKETSVSGISGLCDSAGNRLTLVFKNGAMYRIALPELYCSSLVYRCTEALKALLPTDKVMQVLLKWYGTRNAPGSQGMTVSQEWAMFTSHLYSLMGYNLEKMSEINTSTESDSTGVVVKKQRPSNDGNHEDWKYILQSKMHKTSNMALCDTLKLKKTPEPETKVVTETRKKRRSGTTDGFFDTNALLFQYMLDILYVFHLIYEDIKLNTLLLHHLEPLSKFLYVLAKDLKLRHYINHYWLDMPLVNKFAYEQTESRMSDATMEKLVRPTFFEKDPPSVFAYLNNMANEQTVQYYPYLHDVNSLTRLVIEVYATMGEVKNAGILHIGGSDAEGDIRVKLHKSVDDGCVQAVKLMCTRGLTIRDIENMPPAIGLFMMTAFYTCRVDPPIVWPVKCYEFIMRQDLANLANYAAIDNKKNGTLPKSREQETFLQHRQKKPEKFMFGIADDKAYNVKVGMEHLDTKLYQLLFPNDRRIAEVFKLLQSSTPVTIDLLQRPEVSDHEFIEEQEKYLYAVCTRTMALPLARGMLSLRTLPYTQSEPLVVPKLCISGRGPPPRRHTIELSSENSSDCLVWPNFHNGVAAGLAMIPAENFEFNWVTFNKPKAQVEDWSEHGGFLMALGLNGHLRNVPYVPIYEYFVKSQDMISIGLLLGLSASYRGTMDLQATKVLSIHLESLLPPTSIELDIQQNVVIAALLGLGLVYQESRHTHYSHVLLAEMDKPPVSEAGKCVEREGYALAAALALGFINIGSGNDTPQYIVSALRTYVLGGDKQLWNQLQGFPRDYYSTVLREASGTVNLDVTSPGATLALGLIYIRTNNATVASWLDPPETTYLLDFVRPDLLMLRCIARALIMWDEVKPEQEWVDAQVPEHIQENFFIEPVDDDIDYEAINQAYCNIVTGACFAMGLRYAGTACPGAKRTLLHYTNMFISLFKKSWCDLIGKSTIETCIVVCLVAVAMVMTGTGDLDVFRIVRHMREMLPFQQDSYRGRFISHGGQMAVHSALSLLFLGGGRYTLSNSPTAIAALLTAFFPKYPIHSEDNKYHLQAFRHLYVLAVEARMFLTRNLSSGKLCYAQLQVIDIHSNVTTATAPCMLPPLDTIQEIRVKDTRYWNIVFQRNRNWDQLEAFLKNTWCINLKPRVGFPPSVYNLVNPPSYKENAFDKCKYWGASLQNMDIVTSDDKMLNFAKKCLESITKSLKHDYCEHYILGYQHAPRKERKCNCMTNNLNDVQFLQKLNMLTFDCIAKDVPGGLPFWITFLQIVKTFDNDPSTYNVWQLKLLKNQMSNLYETAEDNMHIDDKEQDEPFIPAEITIAITQKIEACFDEVEDNLAPTLRVYVGLPSLRRIDYIEPRLRKFLAAFITYFDVPFGVYRGKKMLSDLPTAIKTIESLGVDIATYEKTRDIL